MVHEHCFMDSDTKISVKPEDIPKKFVHLSLFLYQTQYSKAIWAATLWITEIMEDLDERVQELKAYKAVGGVTVSM